MAKGISAVIATIMLLMITVALIAVFYVFSSSLVSSSTGAVGGVATSTTDRMLKIVAISTATCKNATTAGQQVINFMVQNVGTKDILAGELKTYVDDAANTATDTTALAANSPPQQITAQVTTYSKTRTLKAYGPSNTEQRFLTCQ